MVGGRSRAGARRVVVSFVLGALVSACGAAGGTGSSSSGADGGGVAPPVPDGTTVALLETPVPNQPAFILSGNFPVPPGTFPRPDGQDPFTVLDFDGTPLATQTEVVSRYPDAHDGADVVEVLARVRVDPAIEAGTRVRYAVVQQPRAPLPPAGTPSVDDLQPVPGVLTPEVAALLADPQAIEITAYDCFGNAYSAFPLDGSGRMRIERRGVARSELRVYQELAPAPPVSGPSGTLPHLFGVHAYVSTFAGEGYLAFDLRFHNGHSGRDHSTPMDDPLGLVYFERIDVALPAGWNLLQNFEDPFFGGHVDQGGRRITSLVAPNPDGTMHVIRWQGQFHRRLAIATDTAVGHARTYLRASGRGFCVPDVDPVDGHEYWSWWNRGTARYFPQSYALPRLDHLGLGALDAGLQGTHDFLEGLLTAGTSVGDYPVPSPNLGWGHPYGVPYGGMTGGAEIFLFDGLSVAASRSIWGLRAYQAMFRMHTDRQATAFYDADGEPTSVERWLVHGPGGVDYVPFQHFLRPVLQPGDPFGLDQAPQFQVQFVQQNGLVPGYQGDYLGFDPHDYQHFIRYTRTPKVLVWLSNDSLAKDDLRMQAENFNLSYHPYANNSSGGYQASGMRGALTGVAAHPHSGFPFGRGESWGFDCALAAYAVSDDDWRERKLPWLRQLADLVAAGQSSCTGFIQAVVSNRFVDGRYRARQAIEESITQNMLQGLRETVFRRFDDEYSERVRSVLRAAVYSSISDMAWFPGEPAPWTHTGVAPADPDAPVWCSLAEMPDDAYTAAYERFQCWSSLAYGFELSGDPVFLDKGITLVGSPDLLTALQNHGLENIENRAALLALAQHLATQP